MVESAQIEADRRIRENEEKNRMAFEERFKIEKQKCELDLEKQKALIKEQYEKALDDYRQEISGVKQNNQEFSALLNDYLYKG